MSNSISLYEALKIIQKTHGKFFGVTFKKRSTQSFSDMICRFGVKKGLKESTASDRMKQMRQDQQNRLLRVWSPDRQGYRSIGMESIKELRTGGEVYTVKN